MSEADWWLCPRCSSLNNLAARKCYKCDLRKLKGAARASEILGYVPVVSWDGKVSFQERDLPRPAEAAHRPVQPPEPPPLREPVKRDILAVAPRPPHPATITYHPTSPAPPLPPQLPPAQPSAQPSPAGAPLVAMGPGPPPPVLGNQQSWPHWQELLDAPSPDAQRLRSTPDTDAAVGTGEVQVTHSDHALSEAIRRARMSDPERPREFIPWPTKDRAPDEPRPGPTSPQPSPSPGGMEEDR